MDWLATKLREAQVQGDLQAVNHWKKLLTEFGSKSKAETYISPFTGTVE